MSNLFAYTPTYNHSKLIISQAVPEDIFFYSSESPLCRIVREKLNNILLKQI